MFITQQVSNISVFVIPDIYYSNEIWDDKTKLNTNRIKLSRGVVILRVPKFKKKLLFSNVTSVSRGKQLSGGMKSLIAKINFCDCQNSTPRHKSRSPDERRADVCLSFI